jgi:predicted Mrr-cat superfamily restriction endonuclease
MEVKVKLGNCRQTNSEDVSVPVLKICREELSDIYARGYDTVTETPKYRNLKTQRRKVRGTEQNPEESSKMIFSKEVLRLGNSSIFLRIDHTLVAKEKEFLSSGGENSDYSIRNRSFFF